MIVVDITQLSNQPQLPPASDKYIHRLPQFGRLCLVALYCICTTYHIQRGNSALMVALSFENPYVISGQDPEVSTYKYRDLQIYAEYTDECVHAD